MSLVTLESLALLHPFAPHITEALYGHITGGKVLAESYWPTTTWKRDEIQESYLQKAFSLVRVMRNLRAESGIKPAEYRNVSILCSKKDEPILAENINLIAGLTRTEQLSINDKSIKFKNSAYGVILGFEVYVDAQIDEAKIEEERKRILEQIEEKKNYLRTLEAKLTNSAFIKSAPEKIVRIEMEKKTQTLEQLEKLQNKYESLEK